MQEEAIKVVRVKCHTCGYFYDSRLYSVCPRPCGTLLSCGHTCKGTCGECTFPNNFLFFSSSTAQDRSSIFILQEFTAHQLCSPKSIRLICGHSFVGRCTETALEDWCEGCTFHCGHGKPCGEENYHSCFECVKGTCEEPCSWKCEHLSCSKRCNEVCDRRCCNERCSKSLPCGHQCYGFCGESCPPLCFACYRGEGGAAARTLQHSIIEDYLVFDNAFLYAEDADDYAMEGLAEQKENNPQFWPLLLPCCQRIVCSGFMDLCIAAQLKGEILALSCPLCKVPVAYSELPRYTKEIKENRQQIQEAYSKRKENREMVFSAYNAQLTKAFEYLLEEKREMRDSRRVKLKEDRDNSLPLHEIILQLTSLVRKRPNVKNRGSQIQLWKDNFIYYFLQLDELIHTNGWRNSREKNQEKFLVWCCTADILSPSFYEVISSVLCFWELNQLKEKQLAKTSPIKQMYAIIGLYVDYLLVRPRLDLELVKIFSAVIKWVSCIVTICVQTTNVARAKILHQQKRIFGFLYFPLPQCLNLSNDILASLEALIKEYDEHRISLLPRRLNELSEALKVSPGHFFMCPNGHVYVIDNCGGAMEASACHRCGERIGGAQHAVTIANEFAGNLFADEAEPSFPQGHLPVAIRHDLY